MPTNKPEVVLPELPEPIGHVHSDYEYCAGRPFKNDGWPVSVYDAGQMRAYGQACIDTLTRPADGEFVMVPKEPTEEMLEAYQEAMCGIRNITSVDDNELVVLWKAMLSAAPQQHGREVDDALPWGWKWLTCSAAHRADAVANIRQMAEDVGAYDEPAGIIPAPTQAQLLASIADALEADCLFERSESSSAQQPAEAVAVDLERFRPMVEKYRIDWSAYVQTMQKAGRSSVDGKKKVDEACELLAIIDNSPPAIDIGTLRELVARWRADASGGEGYNYTKYEEGRIAEKRARASELAALIGDGGEAKK